MAEEEGDAAAATAAATAAQPEAPDDAAAGEVAEQAATAAPAEPPQEEAEKMEEAVDAAAGAAEEEAAAKPEPVPEEPAEEAAAEAKGEPVGEEELPEIRIVPVEGGEEEMEPRAAEEAEAGPAEGSAEPAEGEEPPAARAPEESGSMSLLALPTSATFTEGEYQEPPPLQVGAELGRRISLTLHELEQRRVSSGSLSFSGSSPGSGDESEEGETAEEREREQQERAELAEQYRHLMAERCRLRHHNARLQGKLGELLNRTRGKDRGQAELEQHISDKEQRYSRYLAMLKELQAQLQEEVAWTQQQIQGVRRTCDAKLAKVESQWKAHLAAKKEVAVYTIGRRLGSRQAAIQEVDRIQAREQAKEKEMTEVRLENIKLRHRIQRLEASLKAQEELAEGLHLIDFEQLKIENQTYSEKIDERNEELQKLRRKINNTVQILTQIKEKLQFVEAKNHGQKAQLMAVEALVAQERDVLTKTKQSRDKLRIDNQKLQQRCGLLGNTLLLKDFEEKVDAAELLNEKLDALKRQHAGLSLTCKGLKKKIRGVKSFLPF